MTAQQLALDLGGTPTDEAAVIGEITVLAERAGFTATPTHVFGTLDFSITHKLGGCTIATPDAARLLLTRWLSKREAG